MLITKCIGSILIILSCVMTGYVSQAKDKLVANELENIVLCMDMFIVEVQDRKLDIIDSFKIIYEYASKLNKEIFNEFFCLYNEATDKTLCDIWKISISHTAKKLIYNKEEFNILQEFGVLLGTGNDNIHEINVESLKNSLKDKIMKHHEEAQKKYKAIKTYLYTGILIVIILW